MEPEPAPRVAARRAPSMALAFLLVLVAAGALLAPVWYTVQVAGRFGPFGTLIAWTTASVGVIAALSLIASAVRRMVAPAIQAKLDERNL